MSVFAYVVFRVVRFRSEEGFLSTVYTKKKHCCLATAVCRSGFRVLSDMLCLRIVWFDVLQQKVREVFPGKPE